METTCIISVSWTFYPDSWAQVDSSVARHVGTPEMHMNRHTCTSCFDFKSKQWCLSTVLSGTMISVQFSKLCRTSKQQCRVELKDKGRDVLYFYCNQMWLKKMNDIAQRVFQRSKIWSYYSLVEINYPCLSCNVGICRSVPLNWFYWHPAAISTIRASLGL